MALKSMNIILHCLHDNDSVRLLVTCVGGFACTEWELHNRLNRERVFGSSTQWFEMRINFMNLAMEQLLSMWWRMVR